MKNYFLLLSLLALPFVTQAQITNYAMGDTLPDFTLYDVDGDTINLYSITANGQYVVIDFFFTTCIPCQVISPTITDFYKKYGCNDGDVFVVSVDQGDLDSEVMAYQSSYSGNNPPPVVSGLEGGGDALITDYGMGAFPTVLLIAPNNTVENVGIWPLGSVADLESAFPDSSLTELTCVTTLPELSYGNSSMSIYPNPNANESLTIDFTVFKEVTVYFEVTDMLGRSVYTSSIVNGDQQSMVLPINDLEAGHYIVRMMSANGVLFTDKLIRQ